MGNSESADRRTVTTPPPVETSTPTPVPTPSPADKLSVSEKADAPKKASEGDKAPSQSRAKGKENYKAGEIAEVAIIEGRYEGNWMKCKIMGPGSTPDTYNIHVCPTRSFDNACGFSDKDVPDMHEYYLRKLCGAAKSPARAQKADAVANDNARSIESAGKIGAAPTGDMAPTPVPTPSPVETAAPAPIATPSPADKRCVSEKLDKKASEGDKAPSQSRAKGKETYEAGEIAEVAIIEGRYEGNWMKCKIMGPGSTPDTYNIHVCPTRRFDNACGFSDKDVPDMHQDYLRKVPTPVPTPSPAATNGKTSTCEEPKSSSRLLSSIANGKSTLPTSVQVVIVGAGPVGLFAANLFGLNGIKTLVLERNEVPMDIPRAIMIDDEAFRTLQAIGLDREFLPKTRPGHGARYYGEDGVPFADVGPGPVEYGFPRRSHFLQPELEQVLLAGLDRFDNVQVLFSHTAKDIRQDSHSVVLDIVLEDSSRQSVKAKFVLGCDGARSHVRAELGISMLGETYPEDWVVLDMKSDPDQEPVSKFFCRTDRPYVSVVAPHGMRRYEFRAKPEDTLESLQDPKKVQQLLAGIRSVSSDDVLRAAIYRFQARNAERYQSGRVFLLGDAAHLTPPFAGQGMNAGVRDAHNLAWKICAVLQEQAGLDLLGTYDRERRPAAWSMVQLAVAMGDIIMPESSADIELRRRVLQWMDRFPETKEYITGMKFKPPPSYACGAFANLHEQPFVGSLVGHMLPQPPVKWTDMAMHGDNTDDSRTRLDDVMGSGFALIAQQEATVHAMVRLRNELWPELAPVCVALGAGLPASIAGIRTLCPDQGHQDVLKPMAAMRAHRDQIMLIRPDRFVAAACFSEEHNGFRRTVSAFRKALGQV